MSVINPDKEIIERLGRDINQSKNPIGFCIVLLLSWLAASDGTVSDDERDALRQIAKGHEGDLLKTIRYAKDGHVAGLQFVCEVLRSQLHDDQRKLFIALALGLSLADGILTNTEIFVILFFADLVGIHPYELDELFIEMTGRVFPRPSDPSTVEWWQARERDREESRGEQQSSSGSDTHKDAGGKDQRYEKHEREDRTWAYATLGLEPGSPAEAIRSTYRRLARIHHPDKFSSLGEEAVQAATITFQRIRKAHELLGAP
jgi:DnaJ like chaperone protein